MENASKALLIAGAILLVIAIIGIGMAIFGQAQTVIGQTGQQIDVMAVQAHNSMFDSYIDKTNIKGKAIKELCAKIASYNQNTDLDYQVTISLADGTILVNAGGLTTADGGTATNLSTKINANLNYTVTGDNNVTTGIINTITIKQTGST